MHFTLVTSRQGIPGKNFRQMRKKCTRKGSFFFDVIQHTCFCFWLKNGFSILCSRNVRSFTCGSDLMGHQCQMQCGVKHTHTHYTHILHTYTDYTHIPHIHTRTCTKKRKREGERETGKHTLMRIKQRPTQGGARVPNRLVSSIQIQNHVVFLPPNRGHLGSSQYHWGGLSEVGVASKVSPTP